MRNPVFALEASLGTGPICAEGPVLSLAEGEEVRHVRVAATYGGATTATYITASGREALDTEVLFRPQPPPPDPQPPFSVL